MKKLLLFSGICIFLSAQLSAQVKEAVLPMTTGANNSLSIELPGIRADKADDMWRDFVKATCKVKPEKPNKKVTEFFADNASIPAMSNNTVDIYASVKDVGTSTVLTVWFDLGGAFLSSQTHPNIYPQGEKLLFQFAIKVQKMQVQEELKAEQKKLEKLKDQQKDLEKAKKDHEKHIERKRSDIEDYKRKITEAEKDIEDTKNKITVNAQDQGLKQAEISNQADRVKAVEKKLKDLD